MARPELEAEIRDIQSQLEDIIQQRTTRKRKAQGKSSATDQAPQPESPANASAEYIAGLETLLAEFDAEDAIHTLSTHARDWLGGLNEDLKHTRPSTLLTVFGLGVIIGRLTK
jgi:hypothetical protein